jgi:hypothetical protein
MAQKHLAAILAGNPSPWPSGLDWGSHWYRNNKDDWDALAKKVDDRGRWINPQDDPITHPEGPPKPKLVNTATEIVAAIRHRVTKKRDDDVTRVTKPKRHTVTKSVTEKRHKTSHKTSLPMTGAERMRLLRERKRRKI